MILLNEYSRFNFELNIELNHFFARFNVKMNNQNISATPIGRWRGWRLSTRSGSSDSPRIQDTAGNNHFFLSWHSRLTQILSVTLHNSFAQEPIVKKFSRFSFPVCYCIVWVGAKLGVVWPNMEMQISWQLEGWFANCKLWKLPIIFIIVHLHFASRLLGKESKVSLTAFFYAFPWLCSKQWSWKRLTSRPNVEMEISGKLAVWPRSEILHLGSDIRVCKLDLTPQTGKREPKKAADCCVVLQMQALKGLQCTRGCRVEGISQD